MIQPGQTYLGQTYTPPTTPYLNVPTTTTTPFPTTTGTPFLNIPTTTGQTYILPTTPFNSSIQNSTVDSTTTNFPFFIQNPAVDSTTTFSPLPTWQNPAVDSTTTFSPLPTWNWLSATPQEASTVVNNTNNIPPPTIQYSEDDYYAAEYLIDLLYIPILNFRHTLENNFINYFTLGNKIVQQKKDPQAVSMFHSNFKNQCQLLYQNLGAFFMANPNDVQEIVNSINVTQIATLENKYFLSKSKINQHIDININPFEHKKKKPIGATNDLGLAGLGLGIFSGIALQDENQEEQPKYIEFYTKDEFRSLYKNDIGSAIFNLDLWNVPYKRTTSDLLKPGVVDVLALRRSVLLVAVTMNNILIICTKKFDPLYQNEQYERYPALDDLKKNLISINSILQYVHNFISKAWNFKVVPFSNAIPFNYATYSFINQYGNNLF